MLTIVSLLPGVLLARRFSVFSLVPAMAFGLIFALAAGVAQALSLRTIALSAGISIVSLQMGYLAGVGLGRLGALFRRTATTLPVPPRRRAVR